MRIELTPYEICCLSGDELCVAAAFLELPCLYGVPGEWIRKGCEGLKKRITGITADMERRRLLLVEPGGAVRMDEHLYEILNTMGRAGRICRICFGEEGRRSQIYLYRNENRLVCMEPDGRGRCRLGLLPSAEALRKAFLEYPQAGGSTDAARTQADNAQGIEAQRVETQGTGAQRVETQGTETQGTEVQETAAQRTKIQEAEILRTEVQQTKAQISASNGKLGEAWMGAVVFEERENRFFEIIYDMAWRQDTAQEELSACWSRLCERLENAG